MKKEEGDYLTIQKKKDGKKYKQIKKELNDLKNSQLIFKQNNKEIIRLNKELKKVEEERDKLKKEIFSLNLRSQSEEKTIELNGDLKYLGRVLTILGDGKEYSKTDLREFCCTNGSYLNGCIDFLDKYNLINTKKDKRGVKYYYKK